MYLKGVFHILAIHVMRPYFNRKFMLDVPSAEFKVAYWAWYKIAYDAHKTLFLYDNYRVKIVDLYHMFSCNL